MAIRVSGSASSLRSGKTSPAAGTVTSRCWIRWQKGAPMRARRRCANRARRPSRRPPLPAKPSAPPSRRCTRRARRRRPSRARRPSCRRSRRLRRRRRSQASRRPSRGHQEGGQQSLALKLASSHRPEGERTRTWHRHERRARSDGQQRPALKLASSHRPEGEPVPGTVTSAALDPEAGGGAASRVSHSDWPQRPKK